MLRNKEFRHFSICFAAITALFASAGFAFSLTAGLFVLAFAAVSGTAFFLFTRARYQNIARISEQIDLILHNIDHLYVNEAEEGELSVLQSEIAKMTLRIREQNDTLKREKTHLADSLADIAHQLRTPLTSANLILSLLKNHPNKNEQRTLLRETEELFIQMDWLITSLLKLSRLDAGIVAFQRTPIAVIHLVCTALRPFQISMELHRIAFQTDIPQDAVIFGDFQWLSEAIQNILKNCMENIKDGGTIEITCEDTLLYTQIQIHDNGPGFQKEDLPVLFDRFYRGKNQNASGYGIGLALCRTIITRQGGTITANNHPQGGALFLIRFPK